MPAALVNRLRQYVAPLPLLAAVSGAWSTPARYKLVLVLLVRLFTSVIGSVSGTIATGAAWCAAACNSLSGNEFAGLLSLDWSGRAHGVQPSVGSMKVSSSRLS